MNAHPWLRWIVLVGLVVRVGLASVGGLDTPPHPGGDEAEYDTYAWNLAQGNGYRGPSPDVSDQDHLTAYRPPGPSLVYAALYFGGGHHPALARLANSFFGAVSCILIFAIGIRCFDRRIALAASAVWAVWPVSVLLSATLLSEALSVLCFLWLLLLLLRFGDDPTWRAAILSGLSLGICLLVHPSRLFFVPMVGLWVLYQFWKTPSVYLKALAIPMLAGLCMVPWVVRNYRVFGEVIPFSTMGGSVLLQGNNRIVATDPEYWGYNIWDTEIPEYRDLLRAPNNEVERDRVAKQLANEWIKANTNLLIPMTIKKIGRGWTPLLQPKTPLAHRILMLVSWGPVLVLMLIGFFPTLLAMMRARHPGWLLHMGILHVLALNVVFFGYFRYRLVIEPICLLLAGYGLAMILTRFGGSRWAGATLLAGPPPQT